MHGELHEDWREHDVIDLRRRPESIVLIFLRTVRRDKIYVLCCTCACGLIFRRVDWKSGRGRS